MTIKHILRICKQCGLVYANGWLKCPLCNSETNHYKTLYEQDV